jgi:hypothetical protein
MTEKISTGGETMKRKEKEEKKAQKLELLRG